ncbi:MAG: DNA mismatch repair protein MutS [Candidatus Thermoplasmatota archaeon]|jgi:DNA mismatch repair protein MutS|nr:DNA mismatch repair protein MutS [Candidatus Thermoplasmatota archaeon]
MTPASEDGLTPLMRQYLSIKKQHPDKLVMYRMGDFYELFFEDAEIASRDLEITLTARDKAMDGEGRIPLAGIPYHALDNYLPRLIKKGHKVVIVEQVEDPKKAKGIVKREVVRIVTPGTLLLPDGVQESTNTYLAAIIRKLSEDRTHDMPLSESKGLTEERVVLPNATYGIAHLDVSTGDFLSTEISGDTPFQRLVSELMKFQASEVILPQSLCKQEDLFSELKLHLGQGVCFTAFPDHFFLEAQTEVVLKEQLGVVSLDGLGLGGKPLAQAASGAVLSYARENQLCPLGHIRGLKVYSSSDFMVLDSTTLKNLEVVRSARDSSVKGTLLEVLDRTRTAMGSRLMRSWLQQPLMDIEQIGRRLDAVSALHGDLFLRSDMADVLRKVTDIERTVMRLSTNRGSARDLISLAGALEASRSLKALLGTSPTVGKSTLLSDLGSSLQDLTGTISLIGSAIVDAPPLSTTEGGMFRKGYSLELDEISTASISAKGWLKEFESSERNRTGIRTLKVKYTGVFGYFIEVTQSNLGQVPPEYIRKQTVANAERFITPELKEKESMILSSDERSAKLEKELLEGLVLKVLGDREAIQTTARAIGVLDVLLSLAETAASRNYTRPIVDDSRMISLSRSRHPVIEDKVDWGFVPNDVLLDGEGQRFMLLTGPNMAGKSTFMRQVALCVIMAQMGSFVPASSARIGLVDRVFTRVGASDDLVRGRSTFMVEMLELANIMNGATKRSLVILDEIGRGTSTYDGLSLAWAVVEHLSDSAGPGCNTIFATHYHHLTELEGALEGVVNFSMAVKEDEKGITFLRKVILGPASRSYGIEVASLAGIPASVVERAREVLKEMEGRYGLESNNGKTAHPPLPVRGPGPRNRAVQMILFPTEDMLSSQGIDPIREEIEKLDINNMTPLQAMEALYKLKKRTDDR